MREYSINTNGILCNGTLVTVGWPEKNEYDLITNLRNKDSVKGWFLDARLLDTNRNRNWIESGMQRPKEALLSIRFKNDNLFLGTIGWTDWDLDLATACFGRLMVDIQAVKKVKGKFPENYPGIAIDAGRAVRDFAMIDMKLDAIETFLFANNLKAKWVNEAIGLKEVSKIFRTNSVGVQIETIEMRLTRNEWLKLYKKTLHGK